MFCGCPGRIMLAFATQAVVERRLLQEEKNRATTWDATNSSRASGTGSTNTSGASSVSSSGSVVAAIGSGRDLRWTISAHAPCATRSSGFFKAGLIYRGRRLVNWDTVSANRRQRRRGNAPKPSRATSGT